MKTPSLRHLSFCLFPFAFCIGGAGCNIFAARPEPPDAKAPPVPTGDVSKPDAEILVRYLNNQAALLQSIDTRDLSITVRAQGSSVSLEGTLLCQKPRFFKLVGKKLGSQEVLVGSNEERFWFYVKRDPSDALFHCSYTDFDKGVELPYPFEPEWVVEALGMGHLSPSGGFRVEEDKTTFRLIEDATLRGQKVRKVTVFYKGAARGEQPQVKARMLYNAQDKLICQATIKSVSRIPLERGPDAKPGYVTVPQDIKLEWPAQQTELILELGKVKVNTQLSMESFQMPRLGSKQVDLGRDHPTSRGVVPARFR